MYGTRAGEEEEGRRNGSFGSEDVCLWRRRCRFNIFEFAKLPIYLEAIVKYNSQIYQAGNQPRFGLLEKFVVYCALSATLVRSSKCPAMTLK